MKLSYLLLLCFLCFALLTSTGVGFASPLAGPTSAPAGRPTRPPASSIPAPASATPVPPPVWMSPEFDAGDEMPATNAELSSVQAAQQPFNRLFVGFSEEISIWWQSHMVVDDAGGVHSVFYTNEFVYYAYCAVACNNQNQWTLIELAPVADTDSLTYPTLALAPNGKPRLMRYYDNYEYAYSECVTICTQKSGWQEVVIRPPTDNLYNYPKGARYFDIDSQGKAHFVSYVYEGLTYATCVSNCLSASSWVFTDLELSYQLSTPQLALTASGQPRVLGLDGGELIYGRCNASCHLSQSWSLVKIADGFAWDPSYSLRLDSSGRPRVVYYKGGLSDETMFYAWSNTNETSASGWNTISMNLPPASQSIDLAIDSQGRPHIVYANANFDLAYLKCSSGCNTAQPTWQSQLIETGEDLDAEYPLPPQGGWWTGWWIDGYPSLALDADDNPRVTYWARNVDIISSTPVSKAWAIRFAGRGNTSSWYPFSTFLPLLRR